jgi:hypothetical protein
VADAADPYDLDRFIQAEERCYEQTLSEVKDGRGCQVLGTSWLVTKPTPTGSPVKSQSSMADFGPSAIKGLGASRSCPLARPFSPATARLL